MSGTGTPAVPVFSYAQAAQGLSRSSQSTTKSPGSSSVTSEAASKEVKSNATEPVQLDLNTPSIHSKTHKEHATSPPKSESGDTKVSNAELASSENYPSGGTPVSSAEDSSSVTATQNTKQNGEPSVKEQVQDPVSSPKLDSSEAWEQQSQTSAKSNQSKDKTKSKDVDDDWEKVSPPVASTEKELKPAPVPTVNPWQKRKAENEARAKEVAGQRTATTSADAGKHNAPAQSTSEQLSRKPSSKTPTNSEHELKGGKRRDAEMTKSANTGRRDQPQTSSSRPSSRQKDSVEPATIPPVGDAQFWPTPDTVADGRRKSTSMENTDKPDTKVSGTKSHGNKWVQVPFVPTAIFNTPLPPAAARRGGRGGGRGRDSSGRGGSNTGSNTASDKTEATGNMGPPPLPRQQDQDRGRKSENAVGGRAASLPSQGRRGTATPVTSSDSSKVSETGSKYPDGTFPANTSATKTTNPPSGTLDSTVVEPRGHPGTMAESGETTDPFEASSTNSAMAETHAHPTYESSYRSVSSEWQRGGAASFRTGGEGRERPYNKSREVSRDKPDTSREKYDNWRDREPQSEAPTRRESRNERGRGPYRGGRGTHQHPGPHSNNTQPYTAPVPQQPFPGSKSNSFGEIRHRQSSQTYPHMPSAPVNRNNPRSQSIPTSGFAAYPSTVSGMAAPVSPLQTDMPMYAYGQMQPGVMSGLPYNAALDHFALLSMLQTQLEYYFSVDNLCKDMFLRKYMDSQGWVPLRVIAGFRRIKSLTDNSDILRTVCSQLTTVEYLPGQTWNEDRLRRRDEWHKFVLNQDERNPEAQNDGPEIMPPAAGNATTNGYSQYTDSYSSATPPGVNTNWQQNIFAGPSVMSPIVQSINAHSEAVGLERVTSMNGSQAHRTSPGIPLTSGSTNAEDEPTTPVMNGIVPGPNGQPPQSRVFSDDDENVFPNDQVSELNLIIRKPEEVSHTAQPPFVSNANRTFSHGSIGSREMPSGVASSSEEVSVSGLRGGVSSPQQLEKLQFTAPVLPSMNERFDAPSTLWAKDKPAQMLVQQEGMAHEPYLLVRDRALQQRESGQYGEDLNVLYEFWSHFLVRNFNVSMYEDFHTLALSDKQKGHNVGSKHLVRYYEVLLSGRNVISERITHDIVSMAESEVGEYRPAFRALRSAWRDGAFNLKSRKKIANILQPTLRVQLDR